MKFGLFGMNMRPCVGPAEIATVARAAEEAGFESFWGGEHIALADPQVPASPMPPHTVFVDLTVTIAFVAAHTRTIRLGTGIIILPLRKPVVLAKQLASVDVVSGGRLIFGIGIGNLDFEFKAVGMPFDHKGPARGRSTRRDEGAVVDGKAGIPRPVLFVQRSARGTASNPEAASRDCLRRQIDACVQPHGAAWQRMVRLRA